MRLSLVLNRNAGALRGGDPETITDEVVRILEAQGHTVSLQLLPGKEAVAAIADICRERNCDALIAGGGDGTISTAATAAAKSGCTLGVLPLGTMNLFARALGMPMQPAAAAEALAAADPTNVDIGEVNGRFFTHHVTLGLHPRMIAVRGRLSHGSRLGKIWASAQAWWIVVRRPPRLDATITLDDRPHQRRTAAIFVSNNPLGEGHLPHADDPRQGVFGVYAATSRQWRHLLQLAAQVGLGEVADNPLLEAWHAQDVKIALKPRSVRASIDGEIVSLETPLDFTLHRGGLCVLKPAPSNAMVQS